MRWAAVSLLVGVLLQSGCSAPVGTRAQLLVDGPNVRLNGTSGSQGEPVPQGSHIATGPNSSALVRWTDGTALQLDENSDPLVRWEPPDLAINVGVGWFLIDTGSMRVRVHNQLAVVVVRSRAAIHVVPGRRFEVYLFEGLAQPIRPEGPPLLPGGKLVAFPEGRLVYAPIAPNERTAIDRRFSRWDFPAVPTRFPPRRDDDDDRPGASGPEPDPFGPEPDPVEPEPDPEPDSEPEPDPGPF